MCADVPGMQGPSLAKQSRLGGNESFLACAACKHLLVCCIVCLTADSLPRQTIHYRQRVGECLAAASRCRNAEVVRRAHATGHVLPDGRLDREKLLKPQF